MSFTSDVKEQLSRHESKRRSDKVAEFYGIYVMTDGRLRTHNKCVGERAEKLCVRSGGVAARTFFREGARPVYGVDLRWSGSFSLTDRNSAAAFLRGCFLAGGYVNDPDSPAHIEITFKNLTSYELGIAAFELCDIVPKGTIKGSRYLLYLKDSNQISAFLVTIGAIKGVLEYENVRIMREGRRNSNRVLNCDDANINKALSAGAKQTAMIRRIVEAGRLEELPEGVREIAKLREENPELSLTEIGELCSPPLSKAGVAHRFAKIEKLFGEIEKAGG